MAFKDRIVELRRIRASELMAHPRNFRRHPPEQVAALRGVLQAIGYSAALVGRDTPDGVVLIDGHARAQLDPDQIVPVLILNVTEPEADTLLASLDPIGAMAEIDSTALERLLSQADVPTAKLLLHLESLVAADTNRTRDWAERADSLPDLAGDVLTRRGDLWRLGKHRLLCGDATDSADVARLMDGQLAQLLCTDPPYAISYTGADRPSHGKDWSSVYHEIEADEAEPFYRSVFSNALRHLADDAPWYVFHAHRHQALIEQIWSELDIIWHQTLIWVKPTFTHGFSFFPWQHEPIAFGWPRGHKPRHDGDNSSMSTVWHVDWAGAARIVGNEHPTTKPSELFQRPMRKHTRPGDICYEPFSGSGSQIIAAEAEGRVCYALEIEPRFCDLAVRRFELLTGERAVREPKTSRRRSRKAGAQ